jgi:IclR family KDG regulon transcriptional repressor
MPSGFKKDVASDFRQVGVSMENGRDYTVNAVKKAISLLKCFDAQHRELTLSQLSMLSQIDKSTALRLLYTLKNEGFVSYDSVTKKYSLGIMLYQLGQLKYNSLDIRKITRKYLQALCDELHLIGYLGIRQGDYLIMLEKLFPQDIPLWAQLMATEDYRELYSTGIGRLLLSQESEEEIAAYFDRVQLRKITSQTIIDKETLIGLVRQARNDHYSGNLGENEESVGSICVPLYNQEGEIGAGISICGPMDEIWNDRFEENLGKVREVAGKISQEWGFSGIYQ